MTLYDASAPKKNTTVSINSDLLRRARELGVNLSGTLEERLEQILVAHQRQQWLEENQEAIEAYNERIAADGTFSDGVRSF